MVELARGSVTDRPWGRTLAALGLRAISGQLTLLSDGKHFLVAFEHGAIVAAASPLASDAAVRVALTSHLISSSQVPEISRRQAAAPERDEIDVIAELARLGPDHALRLRRRVIAQRAARTFSINHGEFLVTDATELQVLRGCELDIRAIIYMGARANLSEARLASELDQLGGWFRLKPAVDEDLPQFGFSDAEQPVIERLRDGGTLAELEDFATSFVDPRTVRAVVYALAAYNACEVGPAPPGAQARRVEASSPGMAATQPLPRITAPGAPLTHAVPRPFTQPLPRTVTPDKARRATPSGPVPRTVTPEAPGRARPTSGLQQTEPMTTFAAGEGAELTGARGPSAHQRTEPMTALPDDGLPGESPDARRVHRRTTPPPPSADTRFDPPTQRDALGPADLSAVPAGPPSPRDPPRRLSELGAPRDGVSPGLSRPLTRSGAVDESAPVRQRTTSPGLQRPLEARSTGSSPRIERPGDERLRDRTSSSPALRFPTDDDGAGSLPQTHGGDDDRSRDWASPALRFPTDDDGAGSIPARRHPTEDGGGARRHPTEDGGTRRHPTEDGGARTGDDGRPRMGSNPGMRPLGDDGRPRVGSNPGMRPLDDDRARTGSNPALRPPAEDSRSRTGSNPALRPPAEDSRSRTGSNPALRPPAEDSRSRTGSNPALRRPADAMRDDATLAQALQTPTYRDLPALQPDDDAARLGALPRPRDDARARAATHATGGAAHATSGATHAAGGGAHAATSAPAIGLGPMDPPVAPASLVIRRPPPSRPPVARQVVHSDSPHAHQVKALIAQRLKQLDQGADHFQLIGAPPDASPEALRKAYFALARQLHPDRLAALGISDDGKHAQRLFAQINAGFAILSDPARREHYLNIQRRGGLAAIQAEQAKAEELARRIVEAEDAFHRGELALRRDQPQAAIAELARAVQLNAEEADYHALLAWAQFCAAPDKASVATATRTALDKAIQRSPRAVTARFYLGRVERMLGRDQDALRHFRDVLAEAPGHTEAATELRVLEARLGGDKPPGGGLFGRNKR